ncbi:MAG: PQQ-binding-like beta-propeller repeat protein, partial [Pyrinomonadaceae bacterium]
YDVCFESAKRNRTMPAMGKFFKRSQGRLSRAAGAGIRLACLFIVLALPFSSQPVTSERISFSAPLTLQWAYESREALNLTPAAGLKVVYLPLSNGKVVSLEVSSGEMRWRAEIGGQFSASPLADETGVYIASETQALSPVGSSAQQGRQVPRATGALRLLGGASGVTRWMRTLHLPLKGALVANSNAVFGAATDGRIYSFRKETGEVIWVKQYVAPFACQPTLANGKLYLGSENGTLLALDQETGKTIWRYQTRGEINGAIAADHGVVYFGSADGFVYAFDESTGKLRWRRRTGAGVQSVVLAAGGVIAPSLDNFVYFLSAESGALLWKRQLAGRIAARPLPDGENALFSPLAGDACIVLSLRTGKQTNTLVVGEGNNTAASPVVADGAVLVTTRAGLLAFAPPLANTSK